MKQSKLLSKLLLLSLVLATQNLISIIAKHIYNKAIKSRLYAELLISKYENFSQGKHSFMHTISTGRQ